MRVAVTFEQCWHDVPGGTAVAAVEVARRLAARRTDEVTQVGVAALHRRAPGLTPPVPVHHLDLPRVALYESWGRFGRPTIERVTGPVDVVHATSVIVPGAQAPIVVTLHDVAFLHDPEHFTPHGVRLMTRHLARVCSDAAIVLCSSMATWHDCEAYGIDRRRLRHVPLGVGDEPATADHVEAARRRYDLDGPFLVFVGTLEPRKNLEGLLTAVERLGSDRLPLVVIGPTGWGPELGERAGRLGARLLGYVPDVDRRALVAAAEVCCYPSLREGFGLPVLEAMVQGTPVVTSRGTSTEEVAGGAAVLVEPSDPADIARGIALARDRHDELATAGRARAAAMTWERTATLTLAAYAEAAR